MAAILQLNFKLNISAEDWKQNSASLAQPFAELPGLRWKIWMLNEENGEAGGIYLFETDSYLQDFLEGPLAAQVGSAPFLRDLEVKRFDVMERATEMTRGPVRETAAA